MKHEKELPSQWYNDGYSHSEEYKKHYTESVYYAAWTLSLQRIIDLKPAKILEIGCGPGQFAAAINDWMDVDYLGFDFSSTAIDMARKNVPEYRFETADIFATNLWSEDYDLAIAFEVLEHISDELHVFKSLKIGTDFIGSVPNFDSEAHVRFFAHENEVRERYEPFVDNFLITTVPMTKYGAKIFVFSGKIRG